MPCRLLTPFALVFGLLSVGFDPRGVVPPPCATLVRRCCVDVYGFRVWLGVSLWVCVWWFGFLGVGLGGFRPWFLLGLFLIDAALCLPLGFRSACSMCSFPVLVRCFLFHVRWCHPWCWPVSGSGGLRSGPYAPHLLRGVGRSHCPP